ncbi:hypothetical protein [Longispora albida]|uniref:hypothetical protein n=1 Tax=Longispora albida TaxID=203523 RepID=UPI000361720F|nr:hypothetical protein [Longispora albida]
MDVLREQEATQRAADAVVADLGLAELLRAAGDPVRVGSSALGLMVARDIDITVVCPRLDEGVARTVVNIGADLGLHPRVREVRFRDDTGVWNTDPDYPDGLYLGPAYRAPGGADWTLDIWFVDEPHRQPDLRHVRDLPPRLTDETRRAILEIKRAWPGMSSDVYLAVLDDGVRTAGQFEAWRRTR